MNEIRNSLRLRKSRICIRKTWIRKIQTVSINSQDKVKLAAEFHHLGNPKGLTREKEINFPKVTWIIDLSELTQNLKGSSSLRGQILVRLAAITKIWPLLRSRVGWLMLNLLLQMIEIHIPEQATALASWQLQTSTKWRKINITTNFHSHTSKPRKMLTHQF